MGSSFCELLAAQIWFILYTTLVNKSWRHVLEYLIAFFFKLFSFASPAQKKWRINYAFKPFALIVRWFARLSVRLRLILLPYFSLICIRSGSTTPPHPVRSRLWCLIKQSLQAVEFTGVCSISSSSFNIHLLREIIAKNKKKERDEREKKIMMMKKKKTENKVSLWSDL